MDQKKQPKCAKCPFVVGNCILSWQTIPEAISQFDRFLTQPYAWARIACLQSNIIFLQTIAASLTDKDEQITG
jgi:hypothetical protein